MYHFILRLNKTHCKLNHFIWYLSFLNIILYHIPLYEYAFKNLDLGLSAILILLGLTLALLSINVVLFSFMAFLLPIKFFKFFLVLFFFCNALALYFINTYNILLDKTMMGNILNTNFSEARSYYDINILGYLVLFFLLPFILISILKIDKVRPSQLFLNSTILLMGSLVFLYINSPTWLWFDKHAKVLGALSLPWSYAINSFRFQHQINKKQAQKTSLPKATFINDEKMVFVLIIGESARATNFSLYGYEKETNVKLKSQNLLVLQNAYASTTYTTASIHTMLSHRGLTQDTYDVLPNYLKQEGVEVIWRANNWGAPVLNGINYETMDDIVKNCQGHRCGYDENLIRGLKQKILNMKKNKMFIVLHTEGSHGPTYYKKYPKSFETFRPVCKSVDISLCSKKELINAYDNTVVYTDYVINSVIEELKQFKKLPIMMIYISDHGESLGEQGFYLHGTPYSIAPGFQKEIPFLVWQSNEFLKSRGFKVPYIRDLKSYGHHHIFHTVMGAFSMRSSIYNKHNDLLHLEQ